METENENDLAILPGDCFLGDDFLQSLKKLGGGEDDFERVQFFNEIKQSPWEYGTKIAEFSSFSTNVLLQSTCQYVGLCFNLQLKFIRLSEIENSKIFEKKLFHPLTGFYNYRSFIFGATNYFFAPENLFCVPAAFEDGRAAQSSMLEIKAGEIYRRLYPNCIVNNGFFASGGKRTFHKSPTPDITIEGPNVRKAIFVQGMEMQEKIIYQL